jgi:hypothetical protein
MPHSDAACHVQPQRLRSPRCYPPSNGLLRNFQFVRLVRFDQLIALDEEDLSPKATF